MGGKLLGPECDRMVVYVHERIERWRERALSLMRRVTLIKSVLSSLPVYMLFSTIISIYVVHKLDQIIRAFLWGSTYGAQGVHLLS